MITNNDYNDGLINILSDISDSLSNKDPLIMIIIKLIGVPIIIAIITTITTLKLTHIREKKKERKIEYISSIKLFKDLDQSIIYLKDDIYSNIEFLTFLNNNEAIIQDLYSARKHLSNHPDNEEALACIMENQFILNEHNIYLTKMTVIENKLTKYENEYSSLLYDISDLLTTEEINSLIQYYNNITLLDNIKINITTPGVGEEEAKFYLLDILKVYEGNQYSIINDKHLKSCYEKLYKSSGYDKIKEFEKIKFDKIMNQF